MATCNGANVHKDLPVEFADVEVVVEDETFMENAWAMSLSSPVFRAMLLSDMKEGKTKRIELSGKSKEDYVVFQPFMLPRCVNTEDQNITMENVDVVLPWFHEYGMERMLKDCETLLMTQQVTAKRFNQAVTYDLFDQCSRCLEVVARRFIYMELEDLRNPKAMHTLIAHRFPEINLDVLRDDPEVMQTLLLAVQQGQMEQGKKVLKFATKVIHENTNISSNATNQAISAIVREFPTLRGE
eukprot:NODE_14308_length_1116_cov_6.084934.p1 GENE.NODE_14308_length_1116_cov_6.084934~~NODE_14308_length_1116_cov_6.084934.p1  ORF type:complete len:241 (+),score=65.13 NODE_14308_length_1116_cov_6.084934:61-783(+)